MYGWFVYYVGCVSFFFFFFPQPTLSNAPLPQGKRRFLPDSCSSPTISPTISTVLPSASGVTRFSSIARVAPRPPPSACPRSALRGAASPSGAVIRGVRVEVMGSGACDCATSRSPRFECGELALQRCRECSGLDRLDDGAGSRAIVPRAAAQRPASACERFSAVSRLSSRWNSATNTLTASGDIKRSLRPRSTDVSISWRLIVGLRRGPLLAGGGAAVMGGADQGHAAAA